MAKKYTKPAPYVEGSMAAWLCYPFGLIMPAGLPAHVVKDHPAGTVQVRARDASHLAAFRKYCPEMGPTEATPQRDYDFRAYCHKEDLARAVARTMLEIDSPKFKPLAGRGLKSKAAGDRLHQFYLSCWGAALKLSTTGVDKKWGPVGKTVISKPDTQASSKICFEEGHRFPVGSKGGSVKKKACFDCDAVKDTSTGQVTYPKNHVAWQPPAASDDDTDPASPFYVGSAS
jgi:hypothetical protein